MQKLLLAALAASALATPAFAQSQSFEGPRAEVIAGWDHADVPGGDMRDGATYGAALGYDVRRANTVFGIEGEITGSTLKEDLQLAPDTSFRGTLGRDLYIGGRIGIVAGSNTLLYAKAGYTNLRSNVEYHSPTENQDASGIDGGYRLGAGAEVRLTDKAYLKTEYRFSDYGGGERHQLVGGLGIRF
ncbi:MAG: porin family protein [Sphingomonas sp.]|uniref:outer membrane protein n=1 Tax=Sphingomonas sp. TaxID=28214 RepID=UPI001B01628A|nr:porin family protein [Sphingomonas sp.]MBO9621483.1 porin family protein [Sphingomonas sp.]